MSVIGTILNSAKAALATAAPARVITRSYQDFAERDQADLTAGVYTLMNKGQTEMVRYQDHLQVLLVGQVLVAEDAAGETLEEAELAMVDEVRRFTEGAQGARITITGWRQSQQLERPYGWVAFDLDVGPFDLIEPIDEAALASFITFHADYDLAPPDGQIDATDEITLEQTP